MSETGEGDGCRGRDKSQLERDLSWIPNFKKRDCLTFVKDSSSTDLCLCGSKQSDHVWDSAEISSEYPTDVLGELQFEGTPKRQSYFLRVSWDTKPLTVYKLMTEKWNLPTPNLMVSVVGGEGRVPVEPWVRKVIRQGLVKASQSTGAWIITAGLREGIGRCVGEAVRDHATAASSVTSNKVVALGIAPWGLVHNREQLINPQGGFPAKYDMENAPQDSCSLDNNYQAFLLVDDGRVGQPGGETGFRAKLEAYISSQHTGNWGSINIPVLCMLVSGEAHMLERVEQSLKNSIPWLVLAGSGGAADFISDVLENLPSAPVVRSLRKGGCKAGLSVNSKDRMTERVKKYFPTETDTDKLVEQALNICNSGFITVYHGKQESPYDFNKFLLRALVGASKQQKSVEDSPYIEELMLAVKWNRVDIAKSELFNGDIQWKHHDLQESMTDALINDKPKFIRLFSESGLNILKYLTNGQLETLYCSVAEGTLLYQLLQRRLQKRQRATTNSPTTTSPAASQTPDITLFEVSEVLEQLMGDVCQPFYFETLGLERMASRRGANKRINGFLKGDCLYRQKCCRYPWTSLFILAVLQNRHEMAIVLWELSGNLTGELVLSALGACKILRELSKLTTKTETELSMKELAQKFEELAHDVFSSCYRNDESHSFTLLKRKSPVWSGTTCLWMAMGADARLFFSHDGVQSLLSQVWWGDMSPNTEVWKLLLTFFCPVLCFTNLISFRNRDEEKQQEEHKKPQKDCAFRDNEMLFDATVVSFSDIKDIPSDDHDPLTPRITFVKGDPQHFKPPKCSFILSRWRHFWFAPVTSFLSNVLMYFLFLMLFAYMLLVDFAPPPPNGPAITEYVLYFWMFTIVCEEIRQTFFQWAVSLRRRIRLYIKDNWNKCDVAAIILFIIGLICRMFPWSYGFGRDVLCIDYMVFSIRLIHIFAINKQLGPKIIIVGKMMKDVFFFLFFLAVWLMAYGVATQALIYKYDPRIVHIFRRVFYRPYLIIFGDLPVEDIDVFSREWDIPCTDNITLIQGGAEPCRITNSNWLVVTLLAVYLFVTNIVLINLAIAMFSHTFEKVQDKSDIHWKFQRFNLILEYHLKPPLPPPFILLSHIALFIRRKICKVPSVKINHFELELRGKAKDQLKRWETIQKEDFFTTQKKIQRNSESELFKRIFAKMDNILKHLTETRDLDLRLRALENR